VQEKIYEKLFELLKTDREKSKIISSIFNINARVAGAATFLVT
jgi:hypothetical protein